MTRCSKCLLQSSLPNSNFNEQGECSWCQSNFPNYNPKGENKLQIELDKYKNDNDAADCLVGLSGGKDSSYALIELKLKYGMKVEAFTYVHEGTAPFSVQNAKNICKKLGVKHHIVSLPNQLHLKTFKTFFKAWLENPNTTSAAMICVACKHLHLLGCELAKKRNIPMLVWANCPLEYSPFLAIKLKTDSGKQLERSGLITSGIQLTKKMIYSPKLLTGFIKYFKTSLYGCLAVSPTSKYLKFKYPNLQQIFFYDYIDWKPDFILSELKEKYDWKKPVDAATDWHSDCLFNAFKEYMFQKMLGTSYTDTFLSNQIRYGILSRDEALKELIRSKMFYKSELNKIVFELKLEDLDDKIDYSCFDT